MSEAYDLTAVITTHNEGLVAHKTMRSVLSAIEEVKKAGYSYEIIVHIDNGDEETKKYFKRYEGRKDIRIIENKFGDAGPSRNFAATKARGKYVAFLDGDDLISANWYVKALAILKEHDDAIVYPEAILTFGMDEAVNRLTIQKDSMDIASESIVMVGENQRASTVVARKEIFEKYPYRRLEEGYGHEDYAFNADTLSGGLRHIVARETILFYRRMPNSRLTDASTHAAVLPYTDLFDFEKMKKYKYLDKGNEIDSKFGRKGYDLYKRIRGNEKINKYITPIAKIVRKCVKGEIETQKVPNFVIKEWAKMNEIDTELYPYKDALKSMQFFDSRGYINAGKSYCNLAKSVTKTPDYVFIVPWMKRGGADKVIINYINALKEIHSDWHFAIIATLPDKNVWSNMLPEGVDLIGFGNEVSKLWPYEQEQLFSKLIIQLKCKRIHLMNSEFGYRWIRKHKEMLKHGYTINVSHFAAEPIKGSGGKAIFTYDCPYLLSIIDVVTRVYTDNRRVIKEVVDRNAITPSKFKVHYQSERNLKLIKPKDRLVEDGKLNILWASRVVPIKLPDMVAEIGKLLEPDKFRINVFGEMSDEVNKHVFEEIPSIKYWGAYDGFASLPINENDILLYTSYSDGMPNVPLEAAAAGLPIIASNDGGVGEFVKNGKTGILIEDYLNPDAYIPALERALKNPSELLKYAKAAQKLLQEQHGWDKFVEMVKSDIG